MSTIVRCGNCKQELNEAAGTQPEKRLPCPLCGSTSRAFDETIVEHVVLSANVGMKAKHKDGGKPFIEQKSEKGFNRDRNKPVNITRVIDRQNDKYKEEIIDPETKEVIHKCEEPLSSHVGHGNAKQKKTQ
jgi:hypothetical protein